MKKLLYIIFALINFAFCYSQDFEGVIEYKTNFIPKSNEYTVQFLEAEFGKKITTYIKNGFYKEVTEAKFMSYQLFRYDKNRIYFKNEIEDDTLKYTSTIAKQKSDFTYDIFKKSDTILNVVCDKLVYKDNYGIKTYYYSSEYSLDPEFYKDYTYSNKYDKVKLLKSIYLKLVMEYEPFIVEITATSIKRKKLRKKVFKIPKHKILIEQ